MKRKITVLLMAVVMVFTILPFNMDEAHAYDVGFTGKDCTSSSIAASTIDYITAKYELFSKWKGSGQCYGYAEKINSLLASETTTIKCKKKWNKTNIKDLLVGIKAGAHVRIESPSRNFYHSIVILKCTEKEVIWTDGNYDYNNGIRYTRQSFQSFVDFRNDGKTYITSVKKVKTYKYHKVPLLASKIKNTKVALYWTKTKDATSYKVYRATSENGTYKKIATTTNRYYIDNDSPIGKKRYYKVVAVKKSGNVKSNITSGTRRLPNPTNVQIGNSEVSGKIKLSWNKVTGADSYKIYRYSDSKNKYVLIKTTTNLSYIDTVASGAGNEYYYMIKAYKSSTGSYSSGVYADGVVTLPKPTNVTVTTVLTDYNERQPKIKWSKVAGATEYEIYRAASKNGKYECIREVEGCSYVDVSFVKYDNYGEIYSCFNDGKAYYKVVAIKDTDDFWSYPVRSAMSNAAYYSYPFEN